MIDLREAVEKAIIKALKPQVVCVAGLRTDAATLPRVVVEASGFNRRIPGTAIFDVETTIHVVSPMDNGLSEHKERLVKVLEKLLLDKDNNEAEAAAALSDPDASFKAVILEGIEREIEDREVRDQVRLQVVAVPVS